MTVMVVAITGLGSVWRRRFGKDTDDPRRFARAAYYNTTGVPVDGTIRTRSKVAGHARFNSTGGFDSNYPERMINRVFECDEPCVWQGQNKIFFKYMLTEPREPDFFLLVARQSEVGRLHIGNSGWKSDNGLLISFSECGDEQESMLLLPAYGWIRSDVGTFILQPAPARPWIARLQLVA
ncbi:MAG: hypothetical protein ABSC21_23105 [Terriglobia bacterium]|jgi:hypothetical protein